MRDKAPAPDDFSMTIFQNCWDVMYEDVMKDLLEFHSFMKFGKSLSVTFIAFIFKKVRLVEMKDFCAISLVKGFTRLFRKFLLTI